MKRAEAVKEVLKLCEDREKMDPRKFSEDDRWEAHDHADRALGLTSRSQLMAMLDEAVWLIRELANYCTEDGQTTMDPIREIAEDLVRQHEEEEWWTEPGDQQSREDYYP